MLLATFSGQASFRALGASPGGTVKVYPFYRRSAKLDQGSEQLLGNAVKDAKTEAKQISLEILSASQVNDNQGKFFLGQYEVPEYSLVRLYITKKLSGYFGYRTFNLMLRMREKAAQRRLRVPLIDHPHAEAAAHYYEGRFDVIPPDQFKDFGIKVRDRDLESFEVNEDNIDFVSEEIIEGQIKPLVTPRFETIISATGQEKRLPQARRRLLITGPRG